MRRRDFIKVIAGFATAWPLASQAQPAANVPVITLINARKADAATALAAEFRKGLSQTGFTEGKDVVVEYHWLNGRYEDLAAILNDAVGRHVAVIATPANTPGSLAAKAATSTIPVVFGVSDDPVALGLVANLARPGGNVAPSQPTSPFCNRPNSNSSSICKLHVLLVSRSRRLCWRSPTR